MGRFDGRVALVSGAASGIGLAVSDRLEDEGAAVVRSDIHPIAGGIVCDVRDATSCAAAVASVLGDHGRLDILANVAGIGISRTIQDLDPTEWRDIIEVNLTGTFLLSQSALPALLETKGTIVNMGSVAGMRATPYNAAYCASKGGVIMLTKSMAIELAKAGVRVNAVCPASVDTPFLRGFELHVVAVKSRLIQRLGKRKKILPRAKLHRLGANKLIIAKQAHRGGLGPVRLHEDFHVEGLPFLDRTRRG